MIFLGWDRGWIRVAGVVVGTGVLACSFDSSGTGAGDAGTESSSSEEDDEGGSGDSGETSGSSTSSGGTTDSGTTDSGTTDSGTTDSGTTDSGTTDSGTTDSGTTDSGTTGDGDGDPCDGYAYEQVFLASEGDIVDPMGLYGDPGDPPGEWAQSEVEGSGSITWNFTVECPVEVVMWAVVWDGMPGPNLGNDADSYWVSVDGQTPEWKWVYGCTTEDLGPGFSYQPVTHNEGDDGCIVQSLTFDLVAGPHSVSLRNREGSDFQGAAGVARLLVTSDPTHVPTIDGN